MTIGVLFAFLVLVGCVVGMLIPAPAWLPFVLIGGLAVAVLLSTYPLAWPRT